MVASPPVRLTAPPKSLPALAREMDPAPASMTLLPATVNAPDCVIAPPWLRAPRLPLMLPLPRFNAPLPSAIRLPVANAPKVRAFWSTMVASPPVRLIAPPKSLPALARVMAPVPASMVLSPETSSEPPLWVMGPLLCKASAPLAVMSCIRITPSRPVSETSLPDRLPALAREPPFDARVRSPVVVMPLDRVRIPPAIKATSPPLPLTSVDIARSFLSVTSTLLPARFTAPPKSLSALVR